MKEAGLTVVHLHSPQAVKMAAPGKQPVAGAISPAAEQMMRETSPFENSDCSSLYRLPETTQQYQICSKGMFKSSAIQSWADN